MTVTTEYLHVVPDKELASTDKAVTIEEPRGIIRAVGLDLDNKAKTLKLNSGVRGTLQPQALPEVTDVSLAVPLVPAAARPSLLRGRSACAHAEKADKRSRSPSPPTTAKSTTRSVGVLNGNVVITQGTLTIKADRIDFKQNADNSLSATAFGNPVSFRQKRDDAEEYYEGWAQRAEYDGTKEQLELFDNAMLKRGTDEIRSNYISYNSGDRALQGGGPPVDDAGAREARAQRPRARHVPAEGRQPPARPAGEGQGPRAEDRRPRAAKAARRELGAARRCRAPRGRSEPAK